MDGFCSWSSWAFSQLWLSSVQEASDGIQRILHRLARSVRRSHGMGDQMSVLIIIFVILIGIVWACYDDFPD